MTTIGVNTAWELTVVDSDSGEEDAAIPSHTHTHICFFLHKGVEKHEGMETDLSLSEVVSSLFVVHDCSIDFAKRQ